MALAAAGADVAVTAGTDGALAGMVGGCGLACVPVPVQPSQASPATARAVAALFAAGAITDLTPYLGAPRLAATMAGMASAGAPLPVPRMRDGEPSAEPGPGPGPQTGPRTTAGSAQFNPKLRWLRCFHTADLGFYGLTGMAGVYVRVRGIGAPIRSKARR